jgi:hypothetical protein
MMEKNEIHKAAVRHFPANGVSTFSNCLKIPTNTIKQYYKSTVRWQRSICLRLKINAKNNRLCQFFVLKWFQNIGKLRSTVQCLNLHFPMNCSPNDLGLTLTCSDLLSLILIRCYLILNLDIRRFAISDPAPWSLTAVLFALRIFSLSATPNDLTWTSNPFRFMLFFLKNFTEDSDLIRDTVLLRFTPANHV